MKFNIRHKMNMSQFGRLARRFTALSLVFAMSLPTMAFAVEEGPAPAEYVVPTITIEANAVVDRWYDPKSSAMDVRDYLTGDLEVAIRVKTGALTEEQKKLGFNSLGVALKYSPLLTPYKWTLIDGIDLSGKDLSDLTAEERTNYKKNAAQPVDLTTTQQPFEQLANMQTLKSKQITTAVGQVSGEEGKGGYLYMLAQSDRPIELVEDTVLAVVTFRYDLSKYQIVAAEAEKWLTPSVVTPPAGGAETVGEENGGETDQTEGDYDCLLQFASYTDLAGRYMGCELTYNPANGLMYYTGDANNPAIPAPEAGKALELEDPTTSKYQGAPTEGKINFRLVNHTTYNDGGLSLDDLATVLFYDWDDTLIGVLIVPRDGDARKLVNDYVRDHMIHPDLRVNPNVSSLARADNYRGKYPSSAPMAEGGIDATMDSQRTDYKGAEFPLTNKLDYVFLKRPLELTSEGTNSIGQPISTWTQPGEDTAEWDMDYPYIHGWAIIPDDDLTDIQYTHPKNLWTTIGVGELTSYTGADKGGFLDMNDAPAKLEVEGEDFVIADFNFGKKLITEDGIQKPNSLEPGSVYAVKAVYEPGKELLSSGFQYRMISEPYYNKLNDPAANSGGAYSVDIVFERANNDDGPVRGVGRARILALRQETTADIRWEDDGLVNATSGEQDAKTKTTYSNVTVSNVDEVEIQLVLSARFNKVDYYLMEAYEASFVTGGTRSATNNSFDGTAHVIDNYNYKVEGSDLTDPWYDALYTKDEEDRLEDDRSGSHGFVLYGTLNNICKITTQYLRNECTSVEFRGYVSLDNFRDINLRLPTGGFAFTTDERNTMLEAIQAAITQALNAHNGGNNAWWNVEHNWAELTYHQLQWFVYDYIRNGNASLMEAAAADARNVNWCHLHDECAAKASGKPRNWNELIALAAGNDSEKANKIGLLTMTEAEAIAHLRMGDSKVENGILTYEGTPFAAIEDFAAAVIEAAEAGNTTWDTVQDYIIRKQSDETYARANYWWYDGSTSVPLGSLWNSVEATKDAIAPTVKAPGESAPVVRTAKINRLEPLFAENAASATVARRWNNATKNLCITKGNSEGEKFDTFADFRTAFLAAVTAAQNAGVTLEPTASAEELKEYWQKLQYHILNGVFLATHHPEMDGYWWYDGNSKIGDLASLLAAARRALPISQGGENDSTILDLFTLDDLYTIKDLYFRQNFHGDRYTDVNAFKEAVKQFVQLSGVTIATGSSTPAQKNNSWNQLQYYILHPDCDFTDSGTITAYLAEVSYYWWRNGADGEVYSLDPNATDSGIRTLMEAIYRSVANGNPQAYDQLNPEAMELFRLVSSYTTEETWEDLPKFGSTGDSMDVLKSKLSDLYMAVEAAGDDYKTVIWRQIQHYLLTGKYLAVGDIGLPSDNRTDENGYWWREGDKKPGGDEPIKSDLDYLLEEFDKFLREEITDDELTGINSEGGSIIDEYIFSGKLGLYGGSEDSPVPIQDISNDDLLFARFNFSDMINDLFNSGITTVIGTDNEPAIIDWYVLQYYCLSDTNMYESPIITPEEAFDYYQNVLNGTWAPSEYAKESQFNGIATLTDLFARPDTVVETDPETGIITVTTVVETGLEEGKLLRVEVITVIDPATNKTETKTITTLLDADGNELSRSETTDITTGVEVPVGPPPEPVETPLPTESPEPTDPAEPPEPTAPAETPEPSESPEIEGQEPDDATTPGEKNPDLPETELPTPSEVPDPEEDGSGSWETLPEEVDPPPFTEKPEPPVEDPSPDPEAADDGQDGGRLERNLLDGLSSLDQSILTATAWTKNQFFRPAYRIISLLELQRESSAKRLYRTTIPRTGAPPGDLVAQIISCRNEWRAA